MTRNEPVIGDTACQRAVGELSGTAKPDPSGRRRRRVSCLASLLVLAFGFSAAAFGAPPSPKAPPAFVIEGHFTPQGLARLAAGGQVVVPQLRLYNGSGHLVRDFGAGFSASAFPGELASVLQHPVANPGSNRTLASDLVGVVSARGKALEPPAGAGLVFVQYWADWCAPCHAEFRALVAFLQAHRKLDALVLHIDLSTPSASSGARSER